MLYQLLFSPSSQVSSSQFDARNHSFCNRCISVLAVMLRLLTTTTNVMPDSCPIGSIQNSKHTNLIRTFWTPKQREPNQEHQLWCVGEEREKNQFHISPIAGRASVCHAWQMHA